jgi:L-ribulose-5-phosphate 3-epimerase
MIKSISYWAFPGGLEGSKDVVEAMRQSKELGFEAIELCVGDSGKLSLATTQKECENFRKQADKIGVRIASVASGIWWGYNFGSPAAADREKAVAAAKKAIEITKWLGTDALLTIPGAVDVFFNPAAPVLRYDEVLHNAISGLKAVLPTAEKNQVYLAIEPVWNKFLISPTEMKWFVDSFENQWIGVYFDVGNIMPYGYPEQWIAILGQRIKRIHFKDFKRAVGSADGFCDLLEGDVNWPAVMAALKEAGYDGPLTAEMIPYYRHYPEVRLKNTSNAMDAILGR